MAPAHATVDSTLAKFRMPGTSCLTTCALAAVAIRPMTANSANLGISDCMAAPPLKGAAYHSGWAPARRAARIPDMNLKNHRCAWCRVQRDSSSHLREDANMDDPTR